MISKTKENVLEALKKASTDSNGNLRMDLEELADMADYIVSEDAYQLDDEGRIVIRKKQCKSN